MRKRYQIFFKQNTGTFIQRAIAGLPVNKMVKVCE